MDKEDGGVDKGTGKEWEGHQQEIWDVLNSTAECIFEVRSEMQHEEINDSVAVKNGGSKEKEMDEKVGMG